MNSQAGLSKADLHVHTHYSYDAFATPKAIVKRALDQNFKIIAITDHDEIRGAFKVKEYVEKEGIDLQVIIGEEISTLHGHIIGLFLKERIPPFLTINETIKRIKSQGGLVVIPHPKFTKSKPQPKFYRISVHYRDLLDHPEVLQQVDAIEAANFTMFDNTLTPNVTKHASSFNKALVAGSDAHISKHIGTIYTLFPGHSIEDFRTALLLKTTKHVTTKSWTLIDWIHHHLCTLKMPFTFVRYNLRNLSHLALARSRQKISQSLQNYRRTQTEEVEN